LNPITHLYKTLGLFRGITGARRTILLIFLVSSQLCAQAQQFVPKWADDLSSATGSCVVTNLVTDSQNNVYVTGFFSGTVDFDPSAGVKNITAVGSFDVFVGKYKPDGTLTWVESMSGNGDNEAQGIALDKAGNISITGYFSSTILTVNSGPGISNLNNTGSSSGFVIHLDNNGGFLWAHALGNEEGSDGNKVATDSQGDVILTSAFAGSATIDGITYTPTNHNSYGLVEKYDPNGNLLWAIPLVDGIGRGADVMAGQVDSQGNIVISGFIYGSVNFNPLGTTYNLVPGTDNFSYFIAKYTPAGILIWARAMVPASFYIFSQLALDPQDNIYFTTSFIQSIQVDSSTTLPSNGFEGVLIAKYSPRGVLQFAKSLDAPTGGGAFDMQVVVANNNLYLAGYFQGTVNFNPNPGNPEAIAFHGITDLFVAEYDLNGNYIDAFNIGNTSCGSNAAYALAVDSSNNIDLGGNFCGTDNFNPTNCSPENLTASSVDADGFIVQYAPGSVTNNIITPPGTTAFCVSGTPAIITGDTPTGGTGTYSYQWQSSADSITFANITGADSINYTPQSLNMTTYFQRIASSGTCVVSSISNVVKITIATIPVSPVAAGTSTCSGSTATLSVTAPTPGITYNWYTSATTDTVLFSGSSFVSPELSNATTYYVASANSGGCVSARMAVSVTINPLPQITAQNVSVCSGSPASLTASTTDSTATVSWYSTAAGGSTLATGNTFTTPVLDSATMYYAVATDSTTGCSPPARAAVMVTILQPLPQPVVVVDSAAVTNITFSWAAVPGATGYLVSADGGLTFNAPSSGSNGLTTTISGLQPAQSVTLIVEATGSQPCQSSAASAAITGTTLTNNIVYVPNAFTPNGDGINDVLHVHSDAIKTMNFYIYDEWGELLFTSTNIQNGWDGTYKGQKERVGVYVYYLQAVMNNGEIVNKKGTITLLK
jgi:gliding motility-associated-like protein